METKGLKGLTLMRAVVYGKVSGPHHSRVE